MLLACGATDWYSIGRTKEVNTRTVWIRGRQRCRCRSSDRQLAGPPLRRCDVSPPGHSWCFCPTLLDAGPARVPQLVSAAPPEGLGGEGHCRPAGGAYPLPCRLLGTRTQFQFQCRSTAAMALPAHAAAAGHQGGFCGGGRLGMPHHHWGREWRVLHLGPQRGAGQPALQTRREGQHGAGMAVPWGGRAVQFAASRASTPCGSASSSYRTPDCSPALAWLPAALVNPPFCRRDSWDWVTPPTATTPPS